MRLLFIWFYCGFGFIVDSTLYKVYIPADGSSTSLALASSIMMS